MVSTFVAVCTVDNVKEFKSTVFLVDDKSIIVTRIGDDFYAFENKCSHADVPFGEREIVNGQIQCPMHGSSFDIKTGGPQQLPAVNKINTYEVKIENNNVLVAI